MHTNNKKQLKADLSALIAKHIYDNDTCNEISSKMKLNGFQAANRKF